MRIKGELKRLHMLSPPSPVDVSHQLVTKVIIHVPPVMVRKTQPAGHTRTSLAESPLPPLALSIKS